MPELPEITVMARQMKAELTGRAIRRVEVLQPKCLNVSPAEFAEAVIGARFTDVSHHGKWILAETTQGWLLINLGMGGEILLVTRDSLPEKHRAILDLEDGATVAINFWWFGHLHVAPSPAEHPMVAKLGPDMMSLSLPEFRELLAGRRGGIKSFLMNQSRVAGIGNVYIQDPLFKAGVHPLRGIQTLSDDEIESVYRAIRGTLQESIDLSGSHWELDLYGEHGRWDSSRFLVGYREGEPCPRCSTPVEKIKTGSTAGFICPQCQPLEAEHGA
jgi:formamidopyrimidine-DNA glycosylase